jgi:ABC-type thiamine transport system ATPase subunit
MRKDNNEYKFSFDLSILSDEKSAIMGPLGSFVFKDPFD